MSTSTPPDGDALRSSPAMTDQDTATAEPSLTPPSSSAAAPAPPPSPPPSTAAAGKPSTIPSPFTQWEAAMDLPASSRFFFHDPHWSPPSAEFTLPPVLHDAALLHYAYKKVSSNWYNEQFVRRPRPLCDDERVDACGCKEGDDCEENCVNRAMLIECTKQCSKRDKCRNQRLSRREYAKTTVVKTADRGHGLIAAEAIPAHALIHEYCGEVISVSECYARLSGYQAEGLSDFYMFRLSPQLVIDARLMGNAARFINHSCDANAYTQSWTVGPQQRVGIWAKRDIHKGEEVTYDYNAQTFNARGEDDAVIQHCRCGAANCSRYLGERVKQGRKGRKSEAVADVESGEKGQRKKKRKQRKVKRRSGVRVEGEARVVGDSAEVKSGSKATKAASGGSADADAKARRREERRRSRQMEERNRMKEAEQASDGGAAAGVKAKRRTKEKERGRPDGPTTVRAAKADSSALTKASAGRARQAAAREDGMGRKRAREASAVDDDEPLSVVRLRAREAALEEDDVPLSDLRLRLRLDEEEEPLSDLRKRLRLEAVEEQMVQRKKGEKLTSTRATTVRRPPVHCALDVVERSAGEDAAVEISSTASLHAASRQRRAPQGSDTESETEETATEPPLPSLLPPSVPGADSGTESDSEHDHELLLRPAQMRGSNLCDVTARMDDDDGDLTSSSSLSTDSFLTHSSSTLAHSFMHVAAGKGFIGGEGVESEAMSDVIAKPLTTEVM